MSDEERAGEQQFVDAQGRSIRVTGATGDQGDTGEVGDDGPAGGVGATGPTGHDGRRGKTGGRGPQGTVGLTGATGPRGVDSRSWWDRWRAAVGLVTAVVILGGLLAIEQADSNRQDKVICDGLRQVADRQARTNKELADLIGDLSDPIENPDAAELVEFFERQAEESGQGLECESLDLSESLEPYRLVVGG